MADRLSIVVADADGTVRKMLKNQFEQMKNVELVSEVKKPDEIYEEVKRTKPDIVILELTRDFSKTLRTAERIKQEFSDVSIFVSSELKTPELIIFAMRAGASEFLSKPIDPDELKAAIEKALKLKEQIKVQAPRVSRVISVFSKKGGMGVTTLAVNLGVILSQKDDRKTALLDLDLQLGDVTEAPILSLINGGA